LTKTGAALGFTKSAINVMKRSSLSGFTLLELLVSVAVVAILAALLLTVILRARSRAQRTQCLNNLHQLDLALQSYRTDKGYYPAYVDPSDYKHWEHTLGEQMGEPINNMVHSLSKGVWRCPTYNRPEDLLTPQGQQSVGISSYSYNADGLDSIGLGSSAPSYGLSGEIVKGGKRLAHVDYVRESQIAQPNEMMSLGDAIRGNSIQFMDGQNFKLIGEQMLQSQATGDYIGANPLAACTRRVRARHQDTANVVFCDGHAESPKLSFLFSTTNDIALRRWNRDNQPHRELLPLWGIP
jgi:prepilin-type N-terminal cleavage/methylation domain-containing protein/prepilin-type processing-associated H-X9-DG protein